MSFYTNLLLTATLQYFYLEGKDFRGQVRSQEELSRKETLLGSIIDLQV